MSRARLARSIGIFLLVASCVLPCLPFMELAGTLPYQDPTPDMIKKQAADIAAAERHLTIAIAAAATLAVIGLLILILNRRRTRRGKADS